MSINLIEAWRVNDAQVFVKFEPSIRISTIVNNNIRLMQDNNGTPSLVSADPFQTINVSSDYDSIGRWLVLTWKPGVLSPETNYILEFFNFRTLNNTLIPKDTITFKTGANVTPEPGNLPVGPGDFSIVDYSKISSSDIPTYLDPDSAPSATPTYISHVESDPMDGDYYIPEDYNGGEVVLKFSADLDPSFITDEYFKGQQKPIQRLPSRWTDIDITVEPHSSNPKWVVVSFPGEPYYSENNKYRVRILNGIESTDGLKLLDSLTVSFSGVLDPLYLDPEELKTIFTDASYVEIAEAIHNASLDVKSILQISDGEVPSNWLAYEYVKAAAACALSKTFGGQYIHTDSNAHSLSLGDLRVEYNKSYQNQGGRIDPGTAQTWCELATALRRQLLSSGVGMKAVVKGSRYGNPIPSRKVTAFKSRSEIRAESRLQGQLDGPRV